MLLPKRTKYRKQQKGKVKGNAKRGTEVAFGEHGLMALEHGRITARQIEAARIAMTRAIKRGGQVWIKVFPDHPAAKKPAEVRMGKGKGSVDHWEALIKPGRMLYEMAGISAEEAAAALKLAAAKLPIKTKVVIQGIDPWIPRDRVVVVKQKAIIEDLPEDDAVEGAEGAEGATEEASAEASDEKKSKGKK